jgi:hypothetical protein
MVGGEEVVVAVVEVGFLEKLVQMQASVVEIPWVGRLQTRALGLQEVRSAVPLVVAALEYRCWIQ